MSRGTTPSQTVGPFFSIGLPWPGGPLALAPDAPGAVRIVGTVYDGAGEPVPDALVETWQADRDGHFADLYAYDGGSREPGFRGFGRSQTDETDGGYEIVTVKPGPVDGQAPHIDVSVFARGLLHRCVTRIYFPDEGPANADDAVLRSVPEDRRATLIAQAVPGGYHFDIRLQGSGETVFFQV